MKVTHLYRYSYPPLHGGIEQHIHTLVHQLKQSITPEVLVSGTKPAYQLDEGIPLRSAGSYGRVAGAPISPTLPYWMRKSGADLFHFHMPNPTAELSHLLFSPDVPSVVTYHMETVRYAKALKLYRPFLDAFLRRTSRIIVSTPQHIDNSTILPAYRDKCRVIPFGIDVDRLRLTMPVQQRVADLRRQLGSRIVLFIGKFRHYKGLDYLFRAMAEVPGRLVLVGDGEEKPRLQALAKELNLEDRVVWMPHLEDDEFVAALHACDVFVLPSIYKTETFGLAQLEAQACGKPTICTALGTGVEYVNKHGHTGLVVPPMDVPALADALRTLLDDADYRAELGHNAYERVQAEFTQERMAAEIMQLYCEVLNQPSPVKTPARRPQEAPSRASQKA